MRNELIPYLASLFHRSDIRIAIVGIGNSLNGDDAAGVIVARRLISWLETKAPVRGNGYPQSIELGDLLVIDAGPSPESFTGPLRRFHPDTIILVDAAELGEKPGVVRVFDWESADGMSASTHGMPPTLLAKFLVAELDCRVALVGIQPAHLRFESPVSGEIRCAVRRVVANFRNAIARHL